MKQKVLLFCGILASLHYIALNIFIPTKWPAYDSASQTVSELSAIGAPTRTLWVWWSIPYTILMIAFGWAVWKAEPGNRPLRTAGALLLVYAVLGVAWPSAPMHLRETIAAGGDTVSDTIHIALGAVTEILFLLALWFAARGLGRAFRIYSIVTFALILVFGILTFLEAPNLSKNAPTPMIGVWERINIGVFLLWVMVLAIVLMRRDRDQIKNINSSIRENPE